MTLFSLRNYGFLRMNCTYFQIIILIFEIGLSAMDDGYSIMQSRPYGGVRILVRKSLQKIVYIFVFYENPRFLGCDV